MSISQQHKQLKLTFIIIPTHDRKAITLQCLQRLQSLNYLNQFSVIVVDDGSTDGTAEAIKRDYSNVTLLHGNGNLWWTGAIALGMKHAYQQGADYFIWLNDDCLPQQGSFEDLISFCQFHPECIVGIQGHETEYPYQISFGGKISHWTFPLNYKLKEFPYGKITECDMLSGNLVCLPRSVVTNCEYPEPGQFPHYGGDTIYLQSAREKGFKLFVDTRKPAKNLLLSSSSSNISNWFTAQGKPWMILELINKPQSSLYWKLFLRLNINQFKYKGYFIFLLKYVPILIRIGTITLFRFLLPYPVRLRISNIKHKLSFASLKKRPLKM